MKGYKKFKYFTIVFLQVFMCVILISCETKNLNNEANTSEIITDITINSSNIIIDDEKENDTAIVAELETNTSNLFNNIIDTNDLIIRDLVKSFLDSIENKDITKFRSILCDEFYVARYFSGGYGTRGKTLRGCFSKEDAPKDFKVDVENELPIDFKEMFVDTIGINSDIQIINSDSILPDKLDTVSGYVYKIQPIITSNVSKNIKDKTIIIKCNNGFLLAHIRGISIDNDILIGSTAVFLKIEDKYYLSCLLIML